MSSPSAKWTDEAKWIWLSDYDDTKPDGKIVLFRRKFDLASKPTTPCHLKVSADTRYRLFINGTSVSFGPCKSYPERWYFETIDISQHLRPGPNVISAKVLRFSNAHPGSFSLMRGPYPGLIVHCNVHDQSLHTGLPGWEARLDTSVEFISRSEWNYALGPPFLVMNERVQADRTDDDQDISASHLWTAAIGVSAKSMMLPVLEPWKLMERPIPPLPEIPKSFDGAVRCTGPVELSSWNEFVNGKPIIIPAEQKVLVEIHTAVLTTGFLCLRFDAESQAEVRVMCSEAYENPMPDTGPGTPRHKGNRADHVNGKLYGPNDYYTSRIGGNNFEPFWFRAFRYVQLEITTSDKPITLHSFTYRETKYPSETRTKVTVSTELTTMWDISLNTLRNCMHETYEDCPYYEQNQFIMDSRLQMLLTYQLSTDDRLARKTIHEFYASRREDGLLEAQFPSPGRCINIPQFSLFWIFMIHDHMRYYGDARLVKKHIGTIDGILDYFDGLVNAEGLVGQFDPEMWPFVDWVKQWHGTSGLQSMGIPPAYRSGAATYNSLVYAYALLHAADLCNYIGRGDTAEEYCLRADALNEAVNTYCFDGEMYLDGPGSTDRSQHSQIFAILSGATAGPAAADLMKRTLEDDIPQCSYAMSFYVLRAADLAGVYQDTFPKLMQPWRDMIDKNLTTWAEDNVMFRSDCHGWSSSPVNEIVTKLFGVSPASAGFTKLQIKPCLPLLPATATGTFVNKRGEVRLSWNTKTGLKITTTYSTDIILIIENVARAFKASAGIPVNILGQGPQFLVKQSGSDPAVITEQPRPALIDLS